MELERLLFKSFEVLNSDFVNPHGGSAVIAACLSHVGEDSGLNGFVLARPEFARFRACVAKHFPVFLAPP
jgi:hypothetical protein